MDWNVKLLSKVVALNYCIFGAWGTRSGNGERVYELLKIPGLAFDSKESSKKGKFLVLYKEKNT